jgi:hypothetical protein
MQSYYIAGKNKKSALFVFPIHKIIVHTVTAGHGAIEEEGTAPGEAAAYGGGNR